MDRAINQRPASLIGEVSALNPGDRLMIAKGLYTISHIRTICSQVGAVKHQRLTVRELPEPSEPILVEMY